MSVNFQFLLNLREIYNEGTYKMTRARWKDGSPARTVGIYQSMTKRYSYIKDNFPILSLRNINYKAAIDEILWIWQKRSNKLEELNSKIWNEWEFKNSGTIGHSYGYILAKEYKGLPNRHPEVFGEKENLNLVEYLFQQIHDNPEGRRLLVNIYDYEELNDTNLPPCAFETMWSIEEDKLHMTLVQRSGDFFVAAGPGCWNEVQYAFLQCLIAQCCGLKTGNFLHIVQDLHVYDRHLTANKQTINEWLLLTPLKEEDGKPARNSNEKVKYEPYIDFVEYEGPTLCFSERIENKEKSLKKAWELFNSFNQNEYEIINYKPKDTKLKLEVAI
jgi:thymidylate synthase